MRIPVLAGRAFRDSDTPERTRVVVVSESFARKYFHGDALGRHLKSGKDISEIVGICGDVQQHSGLSGDRGPPLGRADRVSAGIAAQRRIRETDPHLVLAEMGGAHERSHRQPDRADSGRGVRHRPATADRALPHGGRTARALHRQPALHGRAVFDSGGPGAPAGGDRAVRTDLAIHHAAEARDRHPAGAGRDRAADHRGRRCGRESCSRWPESARGSGCR